MAAEVSFETLERHLKEAFGGKDLSTVTVDQARDKVGKALGLKEVEIASVLKDNAENQKLLVRALKAVQAGAADPSATETVDENEMVNTSSAAKTDRDTKKRAKDEQVKETPSAVDDAADQDDALTKRKKLTTTDLTGPAFSEEQQVKKQMLVDIASKYLKPKIFKGLPKNAAEYLTVLEARIVGECKALGITDGDKLPSTQEWNTFTKRSEACQDMEEIDVKNIVTGRRRRTTPATTAQEDDKSKDLDDENDEEFKKDGADDKEEEEDDDDDDEDDDDDDDDEEDQYNKSGDDKTDKKSQEAAEESSDSKEDNEKASAA